MLQTEHNRRFFFEVTRASAGNVFGYRLDDELVPTGKAIKLYSWQILCYWDGEPFKDSGNLIPDDLIYDPYYRSGLQYGKSNGRGIIRWNEAKSCWTKTATDIVSFKIEWLGRADSEADLQAFFMRINEDRRMWLESEGRSSFAKIEGDPTGSYGWKEKQRRWQGFTAPPVKFRIPKP